MSSDYTLIIIDMQKPFRASQNESVQANVKKAIFKAIKDGAAIMFVEYKGYVKTMPSLTRILSNAKYHRKYTVTKPWDDGSDQIVDALDKNDFPKKKLRICGVNTAYCVYQTVLGLVHNHSMTKNIEVIRDACWSDSESSHLLGLRDIAKLKVKIK